MLAWERDADLGFVMPNETAKSNLYAMLKKRGLISVPVPPEGHTIETLWITPRSGWKIEIGGPANFKEVRERLNNPIRTRVNFDGAWLQTRTSNPGLELLKQYKDNIYRHLEHAEVLRRAKDGNDYSNPGFFNKCRERVDKHACLDQLSTDGNIQFKDPIP